MRGNSAIIIDGSTTPPIYCAQRMAKFAVAEEELLENKTGAKNSLKPPTRGGYDCEFAENDSNEEDSKTRDNRFCSVCSLVLRDPHQVTCCESVFCRSCIKRVQSTAGDSCCPSCKIAGFSYFADSSFKRALDSSLVRCSQRKLGCEWEGQLGELDSHLNLQPPPDKILKGCQFSEVKCTYCLQPFQRCFIKNHQSDDCALRPYTCHHCKKHTSTFEDIVQIHFLLCPLFFLPCPNKCNQNIPRHELENHITRDCPLTLVNCDFGCKTRLARNEIPTHNKQSLIEHVRLQQKQLMELQKEIAEKRDENMHLHQVIEIQECNIQHTLVAHQEKLEEMSYSGTLPITFSMEDFEQHKLDDSCWFSPPFYTHTHGYKLYLKVCANGAASVKGTHISSYVYLMRGDFDDTLTWPFEGHITVQLLNQLEDRNHCTNVFKFACGRDPKKSSRVTESVQKRGIGECSFIAHAQLGFNSDFNCQYLLDNKLNFRVSEATNLNPFISPIGKCLTLEALEIAAAPQVSLVPINFFLRDFVHLKKKSTLWISPSFYTHPHGYRMCLCVYPNGKFTGHGTHVSLFVCLKQGQYDAYIKWPFRGSVSIEIINSSGNVADNTVITYHDNLDDSVTGRVTDRDMSFGYGFRNFISHQLLSSAPPQEPHILHGNTLRLRVSYVKMLK